MPMGVELPQKVSCNLNRTDSDPFLGFVLFCLNLFETSSQPVFQAGLELMAILPIQSLKTGITYVTRHFLTTI